MDGARPFPCLGTAAIALSLSAFLAGCYQSTTAPPALKLAIPFPTNNLVITTGIEAGDGPTSRREYKVAELSSQADGTKSTEAELLATARACVPANRIVAIEGDVLVAELTDEEHAEFARTLDDWRRDGLSQIVVEIRILHPEKEVSPIDWHPLPVDHAGNSDPRPFVATTISEAQLIQLLRDAQGQSRSNVMMAPKATVFNGQTLTYADVTSTPFVTAVASGKGGAVQPVVETFEDGSRISIRPATIGDDSVDLTVGVRASEIGDVAEISVPSPAGAGAPPCTVQAPAVSSLSAECSVNLPAGRSLLIARATPHDPANPGAPRSAVYLVFTPRLVEEEEPAKESMPPQVAER